MKDMLGNEITIGDMIAYPNRQGSSCWLETATVLSIADDARKATAQKSCGRKVTLTTALERCVLVSGPVETVSEAPSSEPRAEAPPLSSGKYEHEVIVPFTGSIYATISSDDEEPDNGEILELVYEQFQGIELEGRHPQADIDINSFEVHYRISQGNVLYADVNEIQVNSTREREV